MEISEISLRAPSIGTAPHTTAPRFAHRQLLRHHGLLNIFSQFKASGALACFPMCCLLACISNLGLHSPPFLSFYLSRAWRWTAHKQPGPHWDCFLFLLVCEAKISAPIMAAAVGFCFGASVGASRCVKCVLACEIDRTALTHGFGDTPKDGNALGLIALPTRLKEFCGSRIVLKEIIYLLASCDGSSFLGDFPDFRLLYCSRVSATYVNLCIKSHHSVLSPLAFGHGCRGQRPSSCWSRHFILDFIMDFCQLAVLCQGIHDQKLRRG